MIPAIFLIIGCVQLVDAIDLPDFTIPNTTPPNNTTPNTTKPNIFTVNNCTYCDELPSICWCPNASDLHYYVTTEAGDRHLHKVARFVQKNVSTVPDAGVDCQIKINPCKKYQKIVGFGGALTDASAINIQCLSPKTRKCLLESLFHCSTGIGNYFIRLPLGGTDFSLYFYTYDDRSDPDPLLEFFKLTTWDVNYKCPILREAQNISCRCIIIKGVVWRFPKWAKTAVTENITEVLQKAGLLDPLKKQFPAGFELFTRYYIKKEYYCTMAQYILRAVQDYYKCGVRIAYISGTNEPLLGLVSDAWFKEDYKTWYKDCLYPILRNYSSCIKLLCYDDQTTFLNYWSQISTDPDVGCSSYGTHWYFDGTNTPTGRVLVTAIQQEFCKQFPSLDLISTESSVCKSGDGDYNTSSDWDKWEKLGIDIMVKLLACCTGYVQWNLVLDFQGGPNYLKNYCYAMIGVDCANDYFIKRAMFYGFGHFSKFVPQGSVRIDATVSCGNSNIYVVAFEVYSSPCTSIVAICMNTGDKDLKTEICFDCGLCATVTIPKKSIMSFVALKPSCYECC